MPKLTIPITLLFLLVQFVGCDTAQNKTTGAKAENVFGLYSYYVTGYNANCEGVKHSLQLDADGSFILKIYCYADSTSPFVPTLKYGRWTKPADSVYRLMCNDRTTFNVQLLSTGKLKIINPKIDDRINFDFSKDTTKDEWIGKDQGKN